MEACQVQRRVRSSPAACRWIIDFLSDRVPHVKLGITCLTPKPSALDPHGGTSFPLRSSPSSY
ncbi:hypothetical protein L3Q82_009638, partial [Scortum barcoo]